jgi:hypothetical protein
MLIGQDYDKIEFELFGLDLLEPNALIGDTLIFIICMYFAVKTKEHFSQGRFFRYWYWFYIIFGTGFFFGGLGHTFFNYWGIAGKYPSWFLGIISVAFIELTMASVHPKGHIRDRYKKFIYSKLFLSLTIEVLVLCFGNIEQEVTIGLIVPTLNSVIGLTFALGVLGYQFQRTVHPSFVFLWISALVQIPSAIVQGLKINIQPWFDRNDISHVLLISGCILYYSTIRTYAKYLKETKLSVS